MRVYLYGLYMCGASTRYDNTIEHFASALGMSIEDIESAFLYWQEQGLVQVLSLKPIQVKYLPVKAGAGKIKKFAKDKYADFNTQMQSLIEGRMITPYEFTEYYALLESLHIEPTAMVMIAKYCVDLKGADVGYNYILAVAKNWAYSGVKTVEGVEEKLKNQRDDGQSLAKILKLLGLKRVAEPTDFELLSKWRKMGYSQTVLEHIAKSAKGNIAKLDNLITKYFELKLFESNEIENYQKVSKDLVALAYDLNKRIGVYYENVDSIIAEYLVPWQQKGFDADTLLQVATFCFKTGRRTLQDMDMMIARFYKLGITSTSALDTYIDEKISQDKVIKQLLAHLGATREVAQIDRDFYATWTDVWNFAPDVIDYAASLSVGKTSPMAYMNKILANYRANKVTTLKQAKDMDFAPASTTVVKYSYSDKQLRSVFDRDEEFFKAFAADPTLNRAKFNAQYDETQKKTRA